MKKVFNKNQRIGIFIDTQNLYHSAKNNYNSNVNYEEIVRFATAGRDLIRAFAYVVRAEKQDEEKFFVALEEMGIEIKVKEIVIFHTGDKKADWDIGIAVDVIRMSDKLDTIVLVSGDSDFLDVIKYVQSRGVRAEVMAFGKTASQKLIDEADYFFNLDENLPKFLLGYRPSVVKSRVNTRYVSSTNTMAAKGYDDLFAQKSKRTVKPVIGKPIRKSPRQVSNSENVFGNSPTPKLNSKENKLDDGNLGLGSSVFKF